MEKVMFIYELEKFISRGKSLFLDDLDLSFCACTAFVNILMSLFSSPYSTVNKFRIYFLTSPGGAPSNLLAIDSRALFVRMNKQA